MTFTVPKGTEATVIQQVEGVWMNTKIVTAKDNCFDGNDVKADPTGRLRSGRCWGPDDQTIGGMTARDGNYGFYRDGKILVVAQEKVVIEGIELMEDEEESSGE